MVMSLVVLLAGCASLETTAPPVTALAAGRKDTATLELGRRIYVEDCTKCHVAAPVRDYAASRWPTIVTAMRKRSHLSAEKERTLLAYVLAVAETR
jgi:hypothetical protein